MNVKLKQTKIKQSKEKTKYLSGIRKWKFLSEEKKQNANKKQ